VIVDERFNGGGDIADYVIDYLRRPLVGRFTMREARTSRFHGGILEPRYDHQ